MIIASVSASPCERVIGSSHFESKSEMETMQEALERQEQIIQELNEKVAVLTAVATQAPTKLVGVPVADQN